ncbi:MAG TPA: hypothetical protein VFE17_03850 [Candidatus Baltobacteraceae bacterium]|jgi:hypothetical protein|nr:hypothetical protein [Candidatus Baltobacteraceae bacterium]
MNDDAPSQHVYTHPSRVEHWRHVIEIAAFIIAAAWGLYVFVYQERIKPGAEAPNVDFSVHVQHDALIHNKELVTIQSTWHNKGLTPVQIDGYVLNVYGLRYAAGGKGLAEVPTREQLRPGTNKIVLESRAMTMRQTLLQTFFIPWHAMGGQFDETIDPGDTTASPIVFAVPSGVYEAVSVWYAMCYRRADDGRRAIITPARNPDGSFDIFSVETAETAAFHSGRHCDYWPGLIYAL